MGLSQELLNDINKVIHIWLSDNLICGEEFLRQLSVFVATYICHHFGQSKISQSSDITPVLQTLGKCTWVVVTILKRYVRSILQSEFTAEENRSGN